MKIYLQLAAGRGVAVPANLMRERHGAQLDHLLAIGAALQGPPLSVVTCTHCFGGHTADVEFNPASGGFSLFCGEAGWVDLADNELGTIQPNLLWLPDQLAQALNVKPSPKRRVLIEGVAWWLGDIEVGHTQVSIALAIGVRNTAEVQRLAETLQRIQPSDLGLLLMAESDAPALLGDLTRYRPVPIEDIVGWEQEEIRCYRLRLEAWIRGLLRRKEQPVAAQGGRPPKRGQVLTLFDERRQRGEPYVYKLREATAILKEWTRRFPDDTTPSVSAVRSHLPKPPHSS